MSGIPSYGTSGYLTQLARNRADLQMNKERMELERELADKRLRNSVVNQLVAGVVNTGGALASEAYKHSNQKPYLDIQHGSTAKPEELPAYRSQQADDALRAPNATPRRPEPYLEDRTPRRGRLDPPLNDYTSAQRRALATHDPKERLRYDPESRVISGPNETTIDRLRAIPKAEFGAGLSGALPKRHQNDRFIADSTPQPRHPEAPTGHAKPRSRYDGPRWADPAAGAQWEASQRTIANQRSTEGLKNAQASNLRNSNKIEGNRRAQRLHEYEARVVSHLASNDVVAAAHDGKWTRLSRAKLKMVRLQDAIDNYNYVPKKGSTQEWAEANSLPGTAIVPMSEQEYLGLKALIDQNRADIKAQQEARIRAAAAGRTRRYKPPPPPPPRPPQAFGDDGYANSIQLANTATLSAKAAKYYEFRGADDRFDPTSHLHNEMLLRYPHRLIPEGNDRKPILEAASRLAHVQKHWATRRPKPGTPAWTAGLEQYKQDIETVTNGLVKGRTDITTEEGGIREARNNPTLRRQNGDKYRKLSEQLRSKLRTELNPNARNDRIVASLLKRMTEQHPVQGKKLNVNGVMVPLDLLEAHARSVYRGHLADEPVTITAKLPRGVTAKMAQARPYFAAAKLANTLSVDDAIKLEQNNLKSLWATHLPRIYDAYRRSSKVDIRGSKAIKAILQDQFDAEHLKPAHPDDDWLIENFEHRAQVDPTSIGVPAEYAQLFLHIANQPNLTPPQRAQLMQRMIGA